MDRLPPPIVRRIFIAPLVLGLCLAIFVCAPFLLMIAFVADLFLPGNLRTVRLVSFGLFYLLMEIVGLVAMFVIWILSGFGLKMRSPRFVELNYRFMAWWLKMMYLAVSILFGLRINIEERPVPQPGPLLIFCRHAGPGNSLLLIGTMMIAYGRRPRVVMLAKLQWDPLFDTMGNRLPNRFITHDRKSSARYIESIGDLAENLGDRDAFVLFPEGKDFTQRLREKAIQRLRDSGFVRHAGRAEEMHNVLPPRHRGPLAAITRAPEAEVVFVAHSVLEEIGEFKELWRRIPLKDPIDARYWRLSPDEVPKTEEALIEWLYEWWDKIDDWIDEHKTEEASTGRDAP